MPNDEIGFTFICEFLEYIVSELQGNLGMPGWLSQLSVQLLVLVLVLVLGLDIRSTSIPYHGRRCYEYTQKNRGGEGQQLQSYCSTIRPGCYLWEPGGHCYPNLAQRSGLDQHRSQAIFTRRVLDKTSRNTVFTIWQMNSNSGPSQWLLWLKDERNNKQLGEMWEDDRPGLCS